MLTSGASRWMRKHVDNLLKIQGVYWREEPASRKHGVGMEALSSSSVLGVQGISCTGEMDVKSEAKRS